MRLRSSMDLLTRYPWIRPLSAAVVIIFIIVSGLLQSVFHPYGYAWSREGGVIETASAIGYIFPLGIAIYMAVRTRSFGWLAGSVMLFWAILRENDLQTAFTYRSVESLGFYTRDIASLQEKIIAVLVLLPFAVAGIYLMWLLWKQISTPSGRRAPWLGHVVALFTLIAVAMSAEKIFDYTVIEEVCELGIPIVSLLLVLDLRKLGRGGQRLVPA